MNTLRTNRCRQDGNAYATSVDFRKVFNDDVGPLFWLAFLLTGDHAKAERCFVSGLEDCVQANRVFKDWAHSWAKRAIIKNAIRILQPGPDHAHSSAPARFFREDGHLANRGDPQLLIDGVLAMNDFDRVVFVMLVLEHYSEHDCSLLLGCSHREVREARTRALGQITDAARASSRFEVRECPAIADRLAGPSSIEPEYAATCES